MQTDMKELYNWIYDNCGQPLRPTAFIAQIEACRGCTEQPLPDLPDERARYFRLLADYGISLYAVSRYAEAAAVLTRVLTLLEADKTGEELWQTGIYEQALLYRCHALSAQGDKEAARRDAFRLSGHCPGERQYRHLLDGFELYFRTQTYRRRNRVALVVLFVGLAITVSHPADPSVRFLGHVLGGSAVVGGLANYIVWKYVYERWKKRKGG